MRIHNQSLSERGEERDWNNNNNYNKTVQNHTNSTSVRTSSQLDSPRGQFAVSLPCSIAFFQIKTNKRLHLLITSIIILEYILYHDHTIIVYDGTT